MAPRAALGLSLLALLAGCRSKPSSGTAAPAPPKKGTTAHVVGPRPAIRDATFIQPEKGGVTVSARAMVTKVTPADGLRFAVRFVPAASVGPSPQWPLSSARVRVVRPEHTTKTFELAPLPREQPVYAMRPVEIVVEGVAAHIFRERRAGAQQGSCDPARARGSVGRVVHANDGSVAVIRARPVSMTNLARSASADPRLSPARRSERGNLSSVTLDVRGRSSMATKSEKTHAEEQKKPTKPKVAAKRRAKKAGEAEKKAAPHANARAGKKATYAADAAAKPGRPSRKSTRSSANRAKPDTNLTNREQMVKGSPEARARRSRAQAKRVGGTTPRVG